MQELTLPIAVAWSYVKVSLALRFGFFMSLAFTLLNTWILVNLWDAIRRNSAEAQAEFTAAETGHVHRRRADREPGPNESCEPTALL